MKRLAFFVLLLSLSGLGCGAAAPPRPHVVTMEGALGNKFVRAGAPAPVVARLVIAARAAEPADKPPVNLALVIDTSGSMEGKPISDARAAAIALISELTRKDRLAVVLFNSRTEVLLPSTKLADVDMADLRAKIAAIKAEGTTDLAHGLSTGVAEVARDMDPASVNRIVLLGDGVPNDASTIRDLSQSAGNQGISITALGLGPDYDEMLMGAIAQASGGRFHYVDDSSKIAKFFDDEVTRLSRAEAKSAYVDLTPGPGVTIDEVVGQPWTHEGNHARIQLGDLSRGDSRELVVRMTTTGHRSGAAVEIMDAVLHYGEAPSGADVEEPVFLGAHAASDESDLKSGKNDDVDQSVQRIQGAADTVEAIRLARAGDVPGAQKALDNVNQNTRSDDQAKKKALKDLNDALPSIAPAPDMARKPSPSPAAATPHSAPCAGPRLPSCDRCTTKRCRCFKANDD